MLIDPENNIVKLCAAGMDLEGEGKNEEASKIFYEAWQLATTHQEKFIAAHYVARHQKTIDDKLLWDETTLELALKIDDDSVKIAYPSLYLNVAKGYEDLNKLIKASEYYELASSFITFLSNDGYGNMIKGGIQQGIERVSKLIDTTL